MAAIDKSDGTDYAPLNATSRQRTISSRPVSIVAFMATPRGFGLSNAETSATTSGSKVRACAAEPSVPTVDSNSADSAA